jgi:hypothetical protein
VIRSLAYVVYLGLTGAAVALTLAARDGVRARRLRPLLGALGAAAVASFAIRSWGRATPFGDFDKAYYRAGTLAASAPDRLYSCDVDILCFVNLPIVALVFAPLAELSLPAARAVFTAAGTAAVAATVWLLVRIGNASGWRAYAVVAIVCLNGPLYYSARLGNLSHVLLLPLVLGLAALVQNRERAAGMWLAVVAVVKPPLLLFLPYLILRRRWRALAAMSLTVAATVLASIAWFGVELHRIWLRDYVIEFGARPIAAYNVQSLSGMLARFAVPGHTTDWRPLDVDPIVLAARYALTLACLAAAAAAGAIAGRPRRADGWWAECSVVLILALLASPITWTHYYCVLIIPLGLYACGRIAVPLTFRWAAAMSVAGLLVSLPVVLPRPTQPLLATVTERILLSHYVAGAIGLLAVLLAGLLATRFERSHDPVR